MPDNIARPKNIGLASFRPQMPQIPVIRNPLIDAAESNYASEFHKRLGKMIEAYDQELDNKHEVGVRLVSFGQQVVFHLRDMGYWNPSLITFQGVTDDGNSVELIQHVSQISILLMTLPLADPTKPKQPIGFHYSNSRDESVRRQLASRPGKLIVATQSQVPMRKARLLSPLTRNSSPYGQVT